MGWETAARLHDVCRAGTGTEQQAVGRDDQPLVTPRIRPWELSETPAVRRQQRSFGDPQPGAGEPGHAAVSPAIDAVRASVLYAARAEPLRVLLVSSPKRGEGKTPVACHLAASLAPPGAG